LSPKQMDRWINNNKDDFSPLSCEDKKELKIVSKECDR
jgi:hypothetical protein